MNTLIATGMSKPLARHLAACAVAFWSTQNVSGFMRVVSSTSGRNVSGANCPREGCSHRMSASEPINW